MSWITILVQKTPHTNMKKSSLNKARFSLLSERQILVCQHDILDSIIALVPVIDYENICDHNSQISWIMVNIVSAALKVAYKSVCKLHIIEFLMK